MKVKVLVVQLCLTLCNYMDCSLPGSSVHWISQARRLDWIAISFSRGSSWPTDQMQASYVSCVAGRFFYRLSHQGSPLGLYLHPYRAASKITADGDCSHKIKRHLLLGRKAMTNLDKPKNITLPIKVLLVKAMAFPVVMYGYELDHKESWSLKNWCFWTVVLEKNLESLLDSKEIKPVNPERNQLWIFTGRTDAKAEAPIFWPPDVKGQLTGKDHDSGKDWGQGEKVATEDEMVGWHHQLNTHEFEQTLGDGEGQRSLVCCSPWGRKESDTTEQVNNKCIRLNRPKIKITMAQKSSL